MKTTKMSLANMQGKLSRTEMKNIMAGSGTAECVGACNLPQALCRSLKGCSLGSGAYNWKCCTP